MSKSQLAKASSIQAISASAQPLASLSYFSKCAFNAYAVEELEELAVQAADHAASSAVSGALFYRDGCLFQWIEGPEEAAKQTFEKIFKNARHEGVTLAHFETGMARRLFPSGHLGFAHSDRRNASPGLGSLQKDRRSLSATRASENPLYDALRSCRDGGLKGQALLQFMLLSRLGSAEDYVVGAFSTAQIWLQPLISHVTSQYAVGGEAQLPATRHWRVGTDTASPEISIEEVAFSLPRGNSGLLVSFDSTLLIEPILTALLARLDLLVLTFKHDRAASELARVRQLFEAIERGGRRTELCAVLPSDLKALRSGISELAAEFQLNLTIFDGSPLGGKELWKCILDSMKNVPAPVPGGTAKKKAVESSNPVAVPDARKASVKSISAEASVARPERDRSREEQQHIQPKLTELNMSNVKASLTEVMQIDGAMGVVLADYSTGMVLGAEGGGVDLNLAAAGNTEVVRAKMKTMKSLGLNDQIEDILITLGKQFHIIRPLQKVNNLFIYVVLDKSKANLAMARHKVAAVETALQL